jgi:CelD/BcsL family acetyltransferase involved in cellulose biosynthesis
LSGATLTASPLSSVFEDQVLLEGWAALAEADPGSSYFQTREWVQSWWETVAGRPGGTVATVWSGEALHGFLAIASVREPISSRLPIRVSVQTNAGSGIGADHVGWLAVAGAEHDLSTWLATQGGVVLKGVPLPVGEALGGHLLERQRLPRVAIADVPKLMSGKLAKNLRNARRRLATESVEFTWKPPGTVLPGDLQSLYRLHEVRRHEVGDASTFEDPIRRQFHERLLERTAPPNGTALLMATRGPEAVGALYGFVWKNTFSYYQVGWHPDFRHLSLGSVLVLEAIEAAAEMGLDIFDFLRGADDYKYRFGASDVLEGTYAVGKSLGVLALRGKALLRGSAAHGDR